MKKYYEENVEKIFNAIKNPQWRIWKSIDNDNICRQNKRPITSPKRLLRFINRAKNIKKLYVSVSEFLNAHRNHGFFYNHRSETKDGMYHYPRAGYIIAETLLLDSYFFIDLDSEGDLRIAQDEARKIINYLKNNTHYKLESVQFSGSKGVHLLYSQKSQPCVQNPIRRIKYERERRSCVAKALIQKLNLKTIDMVHLNIMTDIFRVYAAPYSLKGSQIVQPIDVDQFMTEDIYSILSIRPTSLERSEVIEAEANDSQVAPARSNPSTLYSYRGKKRDGLSSYPTYYKFMDNMVHGLKNNYVTVIKKHYRKFKLNELKKIQGIYKLSEFYIVRIGDYIYAYNFKVLQFERVLKILRRARSENLNFFITRRHLPIQVSDSVIGISVKDRIQKLGVLQSKYGMYDNHSFPHCTYFGLHHDNLIGTTNNLSIAMEA